MREKKGQPSLKKNSMNGHFSARGIRPKVAHGQIKGKSVLQTEPVWKLAHPGLKSSSTR